jgi:hypothetical protein
MPETLLTPSSIKLYGRVVSSIAFTNDTTPGPGNNNFLQQQLAKGSPGFARIYAFSYQGSVYTLPTPAMFLVHGPGQKVDGSSRTDIDQSGVAAREWEFSKSDSATDLVYWEYEKGDFSIRFDTEAGPFEQILLVAALRAGADMADRATPTSGAGLSGAGLGVRSGAGLSGAGVSGAGLSGAGLSGAGLRGR